MDFKYFPIDTPAGQRKALVIRSPRNEARSSIHFVVLLDTSGSMDEENRLNNVKTSLNHILKFLSPDDQITMIEFNSTARTILRREPVSQDNRQLIEQRISQLTANGGTNMSASFVEALTSLYLTTPASAQEQTQSPTNPPEKQGIILLTDGYVNQGITQQERLITLVRDLLSQAQGTSLTCVGYGTTHNSELLRTLGAEGGAAYDVVQDLEDVAQVFANTLGGLISCTAQQVEVVFPGKNVLKDYKTSYAIHNNPSGGAGTNKQTSLVIGDLVSDNQVVLVFPPDLPTPSVRGCEIHPLRQFNEVCIVQDTQSIDESTIALVYATYYRQEVAQVIESVRKEMLRSPRHHPSESQFGELRRTLLDLAVEMRESEEERPHIIYEVLQEEIREIIMAIEQIETPRTPLTSQQSTQIAQETSQVLAQHAQYLSMGRGVRANFTTATPSLRQLSRQVSTQNPQLVTTFSNATQREISQDILGEINSTQVHGGAHLIPIAPTHPIQPPAGSPMLPLQILNNLVIPPPPQVLRIQRHNHVSFRSFNESDENESNTDMTPVSPYENPITPSAIIS